MFALLAFAVAVDVRRCARLPTTASRLACFVDSMPPLEDGRPSPFLSCLNECRRKGKPGLSTCVEQCTTMRHASPASQACVLDCQSVSDPAHQSQCLATCSSRDRVGAGDVADGCKRCKLFVQFLKALSPRAYLVDELENAVAGVCAEKIQLFPVCQAISKIGYQELEKMVGGLATYEQICAKMGMCEIDWL